MWLTRVLLGHKFYSRKRTPGLQFIGKHRRFRPITRFMVRNTVRRLELEEQNRQHLQKSFLTEMEEKGSATLRKIVQSKNFIEARRAEKMKPHKYLEDYYKHLEKTRTW
ncbi:ribosomal protein 63, mitochondrial-like [Anneissia japonica]|uniref:ribosomal protein 63, mitochondrial-like n=1 Tax=Anneissia japonica TaxID=1529436 RepID=UPI0014259323|nr:ribosomal protein 63, mitochondrial-like [Anneissia japonica]